MIVIKPIIKSIFMKLTSPPSGRNVNQNVEIRAARPPFSATKTWKSPKWAKNDHFCKFHFLNTRYLGLMYTPFDAELKMKFFEIVHRTVTCSVGALLAKNVSKNHQRNFVDLSVLKMSFSLVTRNSTKFGGNVIHYQSSTLVKFQLNLTYGFVDNEQWKSNQWQLSGDWIDPESQLTFFVNQIHFCVFPENFKLFQALVPWNFSSLWKKIFF